ncbi:MAG: phosphomannose isomerase type II C-terminal cupin domain [Alphaproteobacteria bacterium]|jgi:mannose-6-phosphate isomerase-like protein (cupin superfamily)|nr:phosphomannose isomerase type II C-terminal cupin domain [Alphaproteobacteria bacterium]MCB9984216.1 phosphomannose isomerase type II C-terminal cupin domain [Micavibrio sp.]HPQ50547.1 phosphomannose isomerase type II C-terminal cupin domain [Alphaproteobacteria bacterium]HRK97060.1 phosphomannose isomerase type II C-terminal cupin domain [Alphaproteobacteria bacterium]
MSSHMEAYKIGDEDTRPWGSYKVTDVGMANDLEFCEKLIIVNPANILSLQSHDLRQETWRVVKGELTVVLNDTVITLQAGEDIFIPKGDIHAMANLTGEDCHVFERQEGTCREEDIHRYMDAYGRDVAEANNPVVAASLETYQNILNKIKAL